MCVCAAGEATCSKEGESLAGRVLRRFLVRRKIERQAVRHIYREGRLIGGSARSRTVLSQIGTPTLDENDLLWQEESEYDLGIKLFRKHIDLLVKQVGHFLDLVVDLFDSCVPEEDLFVVVDDFA